MLHESGTGEVVSLTGGATTVRYVPLTEAPRLARLIDTDGPDVLGLLRARLSGWNVVTDLELGQRLVAAGAQLRRHAHTMHRDLQADPVPPEWAQLAPAPPWEITACDRPAAALLPAWREAYPPGHPDHVTADDHTLGTELLQPLLSGRVLGPLLECSALVVDGADRVVAGLVVNDRGGTGWISDVYRRPAPAYAGLGGLLLRRALARLDEQYARVGLAVTVGNPAQRLYRRLGFEVTDTTMTFAVP
ncbi:GNAT family N-acetyltransferase [Saccharopolyspora rhizosphaerae]|uniref:GNAT family N-acetyltransferase n=1 Tax=Saccharopolyspora rhizosphaerae TaxID=2492662 RepID=A0A3R8Q805_9PSEU|nr:GNAT family N-acetyltransferase [Saccharopolyspora rhizosphaerae]RRO20539.1 GNAT family N-acetyltransferase [Saccharopolyspora rhizosphaerae]